jgi:hypothetical protein
MSFAAVNLILNAQIEGGGVGEDGIVLGRTTHSNTFIGGFVEGQRNACIHCLDEKGIKCNVFIGQRANKGSSQAIIQEEKTAYSIQHNVYIGSYGERCNLGGAYARLFSPDEDKDNSKLEFKSLAREHLNFKIDAGGKMEWGSGDTEVDTNLYRVDTHHLKTDGQLTCQGGIITSVVNSGTEKSGIEKTILNPEEGMVVIDAKNNRIYFRSGNEWHYVSESAGFEIPRQEVDDLKKGDIVVGKIDRMMSDGAAHVKYISLKDALKELGVI